MGWLITYPSVLSELVSSSRTPRVPQLHSPRKLPCSPCDVLCAVSSAQKTSSAIQKRFSVSLSLRLGLQPVRTPSTSLWVTRYAGGQDPAPSTSYFHTLVTISQCGMHFKLGLYEHQSAGAIEAAISAVVENPSFVAGGADAISNINIVAYEPAFGIIGDPAKMDPKSRQSADHSMAFI